MPTHKKIHSFKPLQSNAEIKACKRVFFSPAQRRIFSFSIFISFFSPTHGFTATTTICASNVNRFVDSVFKLDTTHLQTNRRASGNTRLASCGVTCLNSSLVFQLGFCGRLTVLCSEIPHERQAWERQAVK